MRDRVLSESGRREGPRASIASGGGAGAADATVGSARTHHDLEFPHAGRLVREDLPELAR